MFILSINSDPPRYLYSYDGQKWNSISNSPKITQNNPNKIKWTGSQFSVAGNVAIEQGNTILKGIDGIHYTPLLQKNTIPPLIDIEADLEFPNTIIFPRNMMLALGGSQNDTTKIAYSVDEGLTWIPSSNSSSVFTTTANNACWNGRTWVAVGKGKNTIATSSDGIQWVGRGSYIFSSEGNCIHWNTNQWIAGGTGTNTLATSYDGVYWTTISNPFLIATNDILWNGTIWVATGIPVTTSNSKSIIYSYDGKSWLAPTQTNLFNIQGNKLSWNGSFWTAVGNSQSNNNIATSNDGIVWNVSQHNKPLINIFNLDQRTFYIDGSNVLMTKDNNFSDCSTLSIPSITTPTAFSYNGSYFLLGGENSISNSPDGIHWTLGSTISNMSFIRHFAWNNPHKGTPQIKPLTIALGEGTNTLGYSKDGIYWKGLGNQIFSTRGNKAVWNGSIWVAVGTGGFWVATSYDGIQWTGRHATMMSEGLDVAWNGTVFVAVGYGGTSKFATSKDGITWHGLENAENIFSLRASAIVWTGSIWLAYGAGGNTTAYSNSQDGFLWQSTPQKNQVIMDASSIYEGLSPIITASSINSDSTPASNAFDIAQTGFWRSYSGTYDEVTGNSVNTTTIYDSTQTANGEWIQIAVNTQKTVVYYHVTCLQPDASGTIPSEWFLLGSNDGTTWLNIDHFHNTMPISTTSLIQIRNIYSNTNAYSQYRIVFPAINHGTEVTISKIELFFENNETTVLNSIVKPIVTKTNILFQNNIISPFDGKKGTFYQVADLFGNVLNNSCVNSSYYTSNIIDNSNIQAITSSCFDGQNHIATSYNGNIHNINNNSLNTNLDFSKNSTIVTSIDHVLTSCFNGQRIVLGGTGGNVITYCSPLHNGETNFHNSLNGSSLFTKINGLSSNSGYGVLNIPNKIYLNSNEKISIVGPRTYNKSLSQKNIISIPLNNVDINTSTDVISSFKIPNNLGPYGNTGYVGPIGETGTTGPIGQIGQAGVKGSTGIRGDKSWILDPTLNITTGNIAIGSQVVGVGNALSVYGNMHVSGNAIIETINDTGSMVTNTLAIGKNTVSENMALDISGNMLISNHLIIGNGSPSSNYQLDVRGDVNVNTLKASKITKTIGNLLVVDNNNVEIDYNIGDEYYIDVGISITNQYNCIINNLPLASFSNTIYEITIINDYTNSTNDRYYCNNLTINGIQYQPYFTNGPPTSLTTKFKQNFTILCIQSNIQIIYCTITNYSI